MNNDKQILWVEKYRPRHLKDCILTKESYAIFAGILKDGILPNLILSGPPGMGKTTIAKALCEELDYDYIFLNSSDERGINLVRETIPAYASSLSLNGNRKVIILDEADNLTGDAQDALRGCIEQFAHNCTFFFTVNFKNKIKEALQSRCSTIEFRIPKEQKETILKQFISKIFFILTEEKVEYNKKVVMDLVVKYFPDFRKTINEFQKYAKINGKIDEGLLVNGTDTNMSVIFKYLKDKKYQQIRQWTIENMDNDPTRMFRKFYENLDKHMVAKSIPQAILYIDDYMTRSSPDPEIHLLAFLTDIIRDCEFS